MEGKWVWGRVDCRFNFGHVEFEVMVRNPSGGIG